MDVKLLSEISRLNNIKEVYKQNYLYNLEYLEEKLDRNNAQIERTTSELKSEILRKQGDYYREQIENLDASVENAIKEIDAKISKIEEQKRKYDEQVKKECESFDFNLEKLRTALKRKNTSEIFDMFESTANALMILRKECSSCIPEQSSGMHDLD